MTTQTNHWKLGLFVVIGVAACAAAVLYFGGRSLRREAVAYKTFFDESVQGLEVGSPVKFRGVNIGNVSEIDLAGDKRHVQVTYELGVKVLNTMGLAAEKVDFAKTKLIIPPDLRVQLASSGITGVKFIQMDFFDEKANPPPVLPFPVPENHIPAAASMMKNLEDSVVQAVDRFPDLARELLVVLARVSSMVSDLDETGLPKQLSEMVSLINKVLGQLSSAMVALEPGKLSRDAQETLRQVNGAVAAISGVVDRVNGEKGLAVSLLRTSDALGNMAQNANHVGPAMEDALRDLQGAAQSVQRLANSLELDPDMLIKGRAKRVAR